MREAVLLATTTASALHAATASWGWLDLVVLENEALGGVCGFSHGNDYFRHFLPRQEFQGHELTSGKTIQNAAAWYRANRDVQVSLIAQASRRRGAAIDRDAFRGWVHNGWVDPGKKKLLVLLEDRSQKNFRWTLWQVGPTEVAPVDLIEFDAEANPFHCLRDVWPPVDLVTEAHVAIIGAGSIGSAAAESLATYGVGTISLVDHDRLEPHNIVRHRCGRKDIGRFKVEAVAGRLRAMSGTRVVHAHRWSVTTNANHVRGLLRDHVGVVIVCTDGVASRQATTHLARWAGIDAVFACVLDDGAYGEIVRVPHRHGVGCLLCLRRHMHDSGGMDPEPGIDLEYGTGTAHRPMTAVGGDLGLLGAMAAKAAVSTLLERAGYRDHRLAGDHLIVGLQPAGDRAWPFDMDLALTVASHRLPPPYSGCIACAASPIHRES